MGLYFCGSNQNVPALACSIAPQLHVLPYGHWLLEVSYILCPCRKKLQNRKWELGCLRQHLAIMCDELRSGHRAPQLMSPPAYPVPVWPDCSLELSKLYFATMGANHYIFQIFAMWFCFCSSLEMVFFLKQCCEL